MIEGPKEIRERLGQELKDLKDRLLFLRKKALVITTGSTVYNFLFMTRSIIRHDYVFAILFLILLGITLTSLITVWKEWKN